MIKHIDDEMDITKKTKQNIFICSICNQQFKTKPTIKKHFKTKKDKLHQLYRDKIQLLEKTYENIDSLQELQCLGCDKYKCHECLYHNECCRLEYDIYKKGKLKLHKQQVEINKIARELLTEFYNKLNKNFDNYTVEISIMRSLLKSFSQAEIKIALLMQIEEGKTNLQGLTKLKVQNAKVYLEIQPLIQKENTIPYYITQYYNNLNLHIPMYQMVRDYQFVCKIKSAYKLNDEQIHYILQYAINKKVVPLTYIQSNIITILSSYQTQQNRQTETDYLVSAINKLKQGTMTYIDIINIYGAQDIFISSIIQALKDNQYNQQYSAIEWLYNIKVPLTKDIYLLAKSNINGKLYHFTDDVDIQNFKQWLKNYKYQFEE